MDLIRAAQARLDICRASKSEQRDLRAAFAHDIILWLRCTGWTFRTKEVTPDGREVPIPADRASTPFEPWAKQAEAIRDVTHAIQQGEDRVVRKSREQGATWGLISAPFVWGWLFHEWQTMMVSRIEDLVDKTGNPDSMFWKVDFLLSNQPGWLLPVPYRELVKGGEYRNHLILKHPHTNATITGEATTGNIGVGGRRTAIAFDEISRMPDAEAAWRASSSTTPCRIAVATPAGVGTHYDNLVSQGLSTGQPKVIELMYYDHPEHGRGREERTDDGSVTGTKGRKYWWSPWLGHQHARRDKIDMAQNIFAESVGSGASVFVISSVQEHKVRHGKDGRRCILSASGFVDSSAGNWWVYLTPDDSRAKQTGGWVIGIDPAYGTGNHVSAVVVMDALTRAVAAVYADPNIAPPDLAADLCHLSKRVYRDALMAWEINGPGQSLARDFEAQNYPHLWCQRKENARHDAPGLTYGWRSNEQTKRILIGELSRAIQQGEIVVPDRTTLDEMLGYQLSETGQVIPGRLRDRPSGERENHGDRVIALALALMALPDARPVTAREEPPEPGTMDAVLGIRKFLRPKPPDPYDFGARR